MKAHAYMGSFAVKQSRSHTYTWLCKNVERTRMVIWEMKKLSEAVIDFPSPDAVDEKTRFTIEWV